MSDTPINPHHVLHQARAFHLAGSRCNEHRPTGPGESQWLPIPAITNHAFSVECSLKAVFAAVGAPETGHNLKELFDKLPPEDQAGITAAYGDRQPPLPDLLSECESYFVRSRYIFEAQAQGGVSMLVDPLVQLSEVCLEYVTNKLARG